MRLDTQDQLTAIARSLDDVWEATGSTMGRQGVESTRRALGFCLEAPSEATWEALADVLSELLGRRQLDRSSLTSRRMAGEDRLEVIADPGATVAATSALIGTSRRTGRRRL